MAKVGIGVPCLSTVRYTMVADVETESISYDYDTGETRRNWSFNRTIRCIVFPYVDGGIRGMGSTETFAEEYKNMDYARVKTNAVLSKSDRLTNVRNPKTGQVLWFEQEGDFSPTVFNVDGSAPITHPLTGNIIEWVTSLSRASVRQ